MGQRSLDLYCSIPHGTREDVPLKFIHMTEAEFKEFPKNTPQHAPYIRVIDDKDIRKSRQPRS